MPFVNRKTAAQITGKDEKTISRFAKQLKEEQPDKVRREGRELLISVGALQERFSHNTQKQESEDIDRLKTLLADKEKQIDFLQETIKDMTINDRIRALLNLPEEERQNMIFALTQGKKDE